MKGIFLLLGSNIGHREQNLQMAIDHLREGGLSIVGTSKIYETEPWGKSDQPWFLNIVLRVESMLSPKNLLGYCLKTESRLGRKRIDKWGERIIDIDLLYYHDFEINIQNLIVPHPAIAMRKFTLIALNDLIPDEPHPILNLTQREMLDLCPDQLKCLPTKFRLTL